MTPELKSTVKHLRRFAKDMRASVKGEYDAWAKGYRQAAREIDNALNHIEAGTPDEMHD